MDNQEILAKLREPFPAGRISWRVGQADKNGKWVKLLAYIDARDVMERLDEVFGSQWSDEYMPHPSGGGVVCKLSVMFPDGNVASRQDGADPSNMEGVKGVLSDAFKRAAVKFGVGRYLYDLGETWGDIHSSSKEAKATGRPRGFHKGSNGGQSFHWSVPQKALSALPVPKGDTSKPKAESPPPQQESSNGQGNGNGESEQFASSDAWRDALRHYLKEVYKPAMGLRRLGMSDVERLCQEHAGVAWKELDEHSGVILLKVLEQQVKDVNEQFGEPE